MNKNQNWRRVLSLLFAMVMLVSMMVVGSVVASAEEVEPVQDEHYVVALKIGGVTTNYTSFDAAWDAMNATGNVQVDFFILEDITLTKSYVLEKEKHINYLMSNPASKFTLTGETDKPLFVIEKGRMTVKNINIVSKGDTFKVSGGTLSIQAVGGTSSQRTNVTSLEGSVLNLTGGSVDFTGGPILTALGTQPAVKNDGKGTLTIKQWSWDNDSIVTAPNSDTVIDWAGEGSLNISYGVIEGEIVADDASKVNISGGTFTADMTKYCDPAYCTVKDADGNYVLAPKVVTVDGVAYDDWSKACANITGTSEIKLYTDVVNNGSFSKGAAFKTFVLDLNGHNFTTTTIGVDGHKTFKIIDSVGTGSVKVTNYTALYANGYLDVAPNVDFNSKIQFNYHPAGSTGCFLIGGVKMIGRGHFQQVDGTMGTTGGYTVLVNGLKNFELQSGNFVLNLDFNTSAIENFVIKAHLSIAADATLALDANTSLTIAGDLDGEGTVAVSTFEQFKVIVEKANVKNVRLDASFVIDGITLDKADVNYIGAANLLNTGVVITAGTFDADVKSLCPDGYCVPEENGVWTVLPAHAYDAGVETAPTYEADGYTTYTCTRCGYEYVDVAEGTQLTAPVAEVNGVLYSSLQEAINACKNGETVKVLADLVFTDTDVVGAIGGATGFGDYYNPAIFYVGGTKGATASQNKPSEVNVVIDLNGHTLTNNGVAYFFLIMDNAKVTFTDSVGGGKVDTNIDAPALWVVGTETLVTIKGGCYETDSAEGVIHVTHGGDLVIEGGEFKTTADDASLLIMLNSKDRGNSKYFIKGVATVTIKGGIFHGFNPAKVGDDNGATSVEDIKFVNGCEEGFCPVLLNENGTYGVAEELTFKGVRLLLKDGIGIYFMLNTADLVENNYVAVFTFGGKTVEVSFADWKHFEDNFNTGILFDGVDAKSIATEVSVVIMSNGMKVSETQSISVKAYAEAILAGNYSADAKALAEALINYGTIANDAISGNQTAEDVKNTVDADFADLGATMNDASVTGNGYYGSSVNLNTYLGFNFKFLASAVKGATRAVITYNGKSVEVNAFGSETKKGNELVVIELDKLLASDAAAELTCTVYNGEQVLATATDSVYNYCARALAGLGKMDETTYGKQNFKSEFYKSLVLYIEAAKNYAEAIEE